MSKKDRIAISITIIWFFAFLMISNGSILTEFDGIGMSIVYGPMLAYWIFRFIKNDISFLNNKSK